MTKPRATDRGREKVGTGAKKGTNVISELNKKRRQRSSAAGSLSVEAEVREYPATDQARNRKRSRHGQHG